MLTSLRLSFFFNLSCSTSFIEPKLLGLQVVIIRERERVNVRRTIFPKRIGFALSVQSSYTAATLTFIHNHRDSSHCFRLEVKN